MAKLQGAGHGSFRAKSEQRSWFADQWGARPKPAENALGASPARPTALPTSDGQLHLRKDQKLLFPKTEDLFLAPGGHSHQGDGLDGTEGPRVRQAEAPSVWTY